MTGYIEGIRLLRVTRGVDLEEKTGSFLISTMDLTQTTEHPDRPITLVWEITGPEGPVSTVLLMSVDQAEQLQTLLGTALLEYV